MKYLWFMQLRPVTSQSYSPRGNKVTKNYENNSVCQIINGGVEEMTFCHNHRTRVQIPM